MSAPWLCKFDIYGCDDPAADNYRSVYFTLYNDRFHAAPKMCQYGGCNDTLAMNYDSKATYNTGICKYAKRGCTDPTAATYSPHFDVTCDWSQPPTPPPAPPTPPPPGAPPPDWR